MPIDPNIKRSLTNYHQQNPPAYTSLSPIELRQWFNAQFYKKDHPEPIPVDKIAKHTLLGPNDQPLSCRLYYPTGQGPFAALMYFPIVRLARDRFRPSLV